MSLDYRFKFTDYNPNYEGMVIVANEDGAGLNGFGVDVENRVAYKNDSWASPNMVIGISTGRFGEHDMEVKLFNPIWGYQGQPYYFYKVNKDRVSLISMNDIKNIKRQVFICTELRGNGLDCSPFIDKDYKRYCYSIDFKNIGGDSLKNTISFFGGKDDDINKVRWYKQNFNNTNYFRYYSEYYDKDIHSKFSSDNDFLNYDPKPHNKTFTNLSLIPTKTTIYGYFDKYWTEENVTEIGLMCASDSFLGSYPDNLNTVVKEFIVSKSNGNNINESHKFDSKNDTIKGLTPNTLYWVRPYAKVGGKFQYGTPVSATTKLIGEKPEINFSIYTEYCTPTSLFCTLEIINNGDSEISSYGVKIGMNDNNMDNINLVQVNNSYYVGYINNLSPNTEYKIYGFAENEDGITYDGTYIDWRYNSRRGLLNSDLITEKNRTYLTSEPYKIPYLDGLNIIKNINEIIVQASLSHDGGKSITEYGVLYSKTKLNQDLNNYDNKITITGSPNYSFPGFNRNPFEITIPNTNVSDKYYIVVYAINSIGVSYIGNITVKPSDANLNSTILSVTENSILVNTKIMSIGSNIIINKGICWGLSPEPTVNINKKEITTSILDSYSLPLDNLSGSTTYYIRPYVTVKLNDDNVIIYGDEIKTTTKTPVINIIPIIEVIDFTNYKSLSNSLIVDSGVKIINPGNKNLRRIGVGYLKNISEFNYNNLSEYENYYEFENYDGDTYKYIYEKNSSIKLSMDNLDYNSNYFIIAFVEDEDNNLYFSPYKLLNTPNITIEDNVYVTQSVKYFREDFYCSVKINTNITGYTYYGIEYSNSINDVNSNILTGNTYNNGNISILLGDIDTTNVNKQVYFIRSFIVKNNKKTYSDYYNLNVYNHNIIVNTGSTIGTNITDDNILSQSEYKKIFYDTNSKFNFPKSPKKGDYYNFNGKTWFYNGEGWNKIIRASDIEGLNNNNNSDDKFYGNFQYNNTNKMLGKSASLTNDKFIVYFNENIKFKTQEVNDGSGMIETENLNFFIMGVNSYDSVEMEDSSWYVDLVNNSLYWNFQSGDEFFINQFNNAINNFNNGSDLVFKNSGIDSNDGEMIVFDSPNAMLSSNNLIFENNNSIPSKYNAGKSRYREDNDGSYFEIIMKISSDGNYEWVKIKENLFVN